MRRLLPLSLCVVTLGLTACDPQPVDNPTSDEELALYEFRALPGIDEIPGYEGNGDIQIQRADSGSGGDDDGVDIILWDVVGATARDATGTTVQVYSGESIVSPDTGQTLCTTTLSPNGLFKELRDADGAVLYSTMGLWTFDGAPNLEGKNPFQQYQELMGSLRFSYHNEEVIEGLNGSGTPMAQASAPIQLSSRWRKLVIASLIDGQCGSAGIED